MFMQGIAVASMVSVAIGGSSTSWQKNDPSQWTSKDVDQILNNSPWSKSVKVTVGAGGHSDHGSGRRTETWDEGGRSPGGDYGRGAPMWSANGRPAPEQTTVVVRWESALPVRLAEEKMRGGAADATAREPLNEYVITVSGLPRSAFGLQLWASGPGADWEDARLADHLKTITVLSVGTKRLNPTKVELKHGQEEQAIFHFQRQEAVTLNDKDAEFRITSDRIELKKKFSLKDMEYQGKLEL